MLELSAIESFYPPALRPFKRNLVREYLHYKILEQIYRSPLAGKLVFMGGTAIHLVHGSARFSEDLDFDNRGAGETEFGELGGRLAEALRNQGYEADFRVITKSAYHIHMRFPGLLHGMGISGHRDEVLTVRIDAEPQQYPCEPEKVILNRFDVFTRAAVLPAAVLLAQKITCLFTRKRTLGRDVFDIIYLSGKTAPDRGYLREKLGIKDAGALRKKLLQRCGDIDFKRLAADVEPFLFSAGDAQKITAFAELVKAKF